VLRVVQFRLLLPRKDLLYPSDLAIGQAHLNPAGMEGGGCQDVFDDPNGPFAGSLILFQDNFDALSRLNGVALLAVHDALPFAGTDGAGPDSFAGHNLHKASVNRPQA
jgi:hypothetical protein